MINLKDIVHRVSQTFTLEIKELQIAEAQTTAILGPSGSGKTTLLRLIAGLERHQKGNILIRGRESNHLSPAKRGVGMVFQDYALFSHMTVFENIAYGLRTRGEKKEHVFEHVSELLKLVQLEHTGKRSVMTLSGGEKQRVAIARALAPSPSLLLLDEPFSALEEPLKRELSEYLYSIQEKYRLSLVYVTHNHEEAMSFANTVGILWQGKLIEYGSTEELYFRPKRYRTASLFGNNVLIPAELTPGKQGLANTPLGPLTCNRPLPEKSGAIRFLCYKPWELTLDIAPPPHFFGNCFRVEVVRTEFCGHYYRTVCIPSPSQQRETQRHLPKITVHVGIAKQPKIANHKELVLIIHPDSGRWIEAEDGMA